MKAIAKNKLSYESEILKITDKYNEYVMTGLHTIWAISFYRIQTKFGEFYLDYFYKQVARFIKDKLLYFSEKVLKTIPKENFFQMEF